MKKENKSIASWITENAEKYLENNPFNEIKDFLNKFIAKENHFSKLEFEDELEIFQSKIQEIKDFSEANKYLIVLKNNQKIIVEYSLIGSSTDMIELTHIL